MFSLELQFNKKKNKTQKCKNNNKLLSINNIDTLMIIISTALEEMANISL